MQVCEHEPLRRLRHWTARYIYDRVGLMIYERRHREAPWLGQEMLAILENWLKCSDRGLEWGSGRSTIWLAGRIASLVSVEHDQQWYQWVNAKIKSKGLGNVEYHLCQDEREYCSIANRYPFESFDFCLVDGAVRDECALAAISLLKPGGIVIVDDCNRYLPTASRSPFSRRPEDGAETRLWATFLDRVEGWRKIWTSNGVTDSGLWVKPATQRS